MLCIARLTNAQPFATRQGTDFHSAFRGTADRA